MTTPIPAQSDALCWRALRRDASRRAAVRAWRDATGGARTLVACSGGADSTALLLSLRSATDNLVVAHVLHDMRPRPEALADRDAVEAFAHRLGLAFVSGEASRARGNAEGTLRRARYRALAAMARAHGAPFVATGHHADDQLETVLMALLRGAGAGGLAGIAGQRPLAPGVALLRPMLACTRQDCERLCALAGCDWRDDPTNRDESRLRAMLRARVLPELRAARPAAARHAVEAGALLRDAAGLVEDRAASVFTDALEWDRAALRAERNAVVAHGLRAAGVRLMGGAGADHLPRRVVAPVVDAVRDSRTHERTFNWLGRVEIRVGARRVSMRAAAAHGESDHG